MRMISGFGYRNPEGYPDPTAEICRITEEIFKIWR